MEISHLQYLIMNQASAKNFFIKFSDIYIDLNVLETVYIHGPSLTRVKTSSNYISSSLGVVSAAVWHAGHPGFWHYLFKETKIFLFMSLAKIQHCGEPP